MRVELKINGASVSIEVEEVEVTIDGTAQSYTEDTISNLDITFAKIRFLQMYDRDIRLEQLPYLLEKLPDCVYWETNVCSKCKEQVDFDDKSVPEWLFDEMVGAWVCPDCKHRDADSRVEGTVADAARKAGQIEGASEHSEEGPDICSSCGYELDPDDDCCPRCNSEEVELMPEEDNDEEDNDEEDNDEEDNDEEEVC